MIKGAFNVVCGGNAGSESKGKIGAYLMEKFKPEIITMASSPNSGHTVVMGGRKYVTYHLPVSWIGNREALICLGPTSLIHLPTLLKEIEELGIPKKQLYIHPRAVMIRDHYRMVERQEGLLKIGSTNQGVGVARREKIMRVDDITYAKDVAELTPYLADTVDLINYHIRRHFTVLCEMTQGFDLCLEHGIDPHYCTSKIINPAMAMAEAGVSLSSLGDVYGVIRPYPIRVNNRDGSSGPYAEAEEITWDMVAERSGTPGNMTELTTTTKLPRRVFEFSWERYKKFVQICGPDHICLQFANYLDHAVFKKKKEKDLTMPVLSFISKLEKECGVPIDYIGTGPDHEDMIDRLTDI